MNRILIFILFIASATGSLNAQTMHDYVRRGNRLMLDTLDGKDYSDKAIIQYKKAIEMDTTFAIGRYNMGNALVKQGKFKEAMAEYLVASKYETDKQRLSDIYHNMGVLLHASKSYAEAVECYKQSLRNDPSNDETRYNYVLAKWHLKNQENQEQNQDNKDKEQDKQEQKDKKDKKDQNQQQQDKKQQEQQQQQEQQKNKPEMSKENAERLLQAAMRNEKETQEKIQRQQQDAPKRRLQKQW